MKKDVLFLTGIENFSTIIEKDAYYVDKTSYLKELFMSSSEVMNALFIRPRRFGKTLNMNMIKSFCELNYQNPGDKSDQKKLFVDNGRNLAVAGDDYKEFREKIMGEFPVISISFRGVEGNTFQSAVSGLLGIIAELYERFLFLRESVKLSEERIKQFNEIYSFCTTKYKKLSDPDNLNEAIVICGSFLATLAEMLYREYGRKILVIIDEYDVPLQKASLRGYYQDMLDVIRPMLTKLLKNNSNVYKVIMTGCLRASKESIFTGMNNIEVNTVLSSRNRLAKAFGFTPDEVMKMLRYYGLENLYENARLWYDGYSIDGNDMFCPWDVTCYCMDVATPCMDSDPALFEPPSYWNGSSSNDIIREFLPYLRSDDSDMMEALIRGESVQLRVSDSLSYGELNKHRPEHFWSILVYTGYLTKDRNGTKNSNVFRIPNAEIRSCFRDQIAQYYDPQEKGVFANISEIIANELLEGRETNLRDSMNDTLAAFVSVRDSAVRAPRENYYHGFINGLLAPAADSKTIRDYSSNRESGDGYPDVSFRGSESGTGTVIELKHVSDMNDLKKASEDALSQIISKNYAERLFRDGLTEVMAWGIAFCGRHCDVSFRKLWP